MPTPDKTPMHLSTNGPQDGPAFYPDEIPTHSAEIAERLQSLNTLMDALLDTQSDSSFRKMFFSVQKRLRQFHLESYHSADEVLIEAYLRTHLQLEEGREIDNLLSWMNSVSYNIIHEYSRRSKRNTNILKKNTKEIATFSGEMTSPAYINESMINKLVLTMNSMSERDREILNLRVGMGLKWREVKDRLSKTQQIDISESTLRKQGERALHRLRRAFDSP